MKSARRFTYLLSGYVEGSLSALEKEEFYSLLATGDYDDILKADFDTRIYQEDFDSGTDLPPQVNKRIIHTILKSQQKQGLLRSIRKAGNRWRMVAAVLLIAVVSALMYLNSNRQIQSNFSEGFKENSSQKISNNTGTEMAVVLPDGSHILLQPKSSLFYSANLFSAKREVFMEGEALFKITKNPLKPFYVYYNDVVTKVLGTTFHISTNSRTGNIEVEVLTGKVMVYENRKVHTDVTKDSGILVTPNQKAIYQGRQRLMKAALVDAPIPIVKEDTVANAIAIDSKFKFQNAKLSDVLRDIETEYGIEIAVANDQVYNCVFSGDITEQDLYNKLRIICLAIGAKYEIADTTITIIGNGCK